MRPMETNQKTEQRMKNVFKKKKNRGGRKKMEESQATKNNYWRE